MSFGNILYTCVSNENPNIHPANVLHSTLYMAVFLFVIVLWLSACECIESTKEYHVVKLQAQLEELRKQTRDDPSNATNYIALGMMLQELNGLKPNGGLGIPEAEMAYRKALEFPISPQAQVVVLGNLGALLMSTAKMEKSLETLEEAIETAKKGGANIQLVAGILFNRGKTLTMLGQKAKADKAFAETIEVSRLSDYSAYAKSFAAMGKMPSGLLKELQCTWQYMRGKPNGITCDISSTLIRWMQKMPIAERSWMSFALWKGLKNTSPAWAMEGLHYANKLQKEVSGTYDRKSEYDGSKIMMNVFSSAAFQGESGFADPTPIFIVGLPRSGSTLIEQLLASHSDVVALGEDTPLAPLVGQLMERFKQPNLDQYQLLEEMGRKVVEAMRKGVASDPANPKRIVDKMLRNAWKIGYIHLMLPRAIIIHAARHPMDAGLSCYAQPFDGSGTPWAWDLREIGHQYRVIESLMQHWSQVLPGRVLKVHYEILVNNFEEEARKIIKHCGLDWQDNVLRFYETERPILTASTDQVRQQLYTTSIGRWSSFEDDLAPLKEELGHLVNDYEEQLKKAANIQEGVKDEL